jgi:hypothetical protein
MKTRAIAVWRSERWALSRSAGAPPDLANLGAAALGTGTPRTAGYRSPAPRTETAYELT